MYRVNCPSSPAGVFNSQVFSHYKVIDGYRRNDQLLLHHKNINLSASRKIKTDNGNDNVSSSLAQLTRNFTFSTNQFTAVISWTTIIKKMMTELSYSFRT